MASPLLDEITTTACCGKSSMGTRMYVVCPSGCSDHGITLHSSYEYNYVQFLEVYKEELGIAHWVKNTTRFYFKTPVTYKLPSGEKRVAHSYVPDFIIFYKDGSYSIAEIKGWLSAKAKAVRKAFAMQFPDIRYEFVDNDVLLKIQEKYSERLPDWIVIKKKRRAVDPKGKYPNPNTTGDAS